MANDIKTIFTSVKEEAMELSTVLRELCSKIYSELPPNYESEVKDELKFTFLDQQLTQAIDKLCDSLDRPTLILATTGTTSSGKSTLVNLLCGAEILPVAVQEMSAGVVTIEYSSQKALKIDETDGAIWECETWSDLSDEDICSRLNHAMTTYLKSKEEGQNDIACPQATIYYPFRLVSEPGLLELPEGTIVKFMDLPGLAHVGDEGNAEVIRKSKEALCLVTYNSADADRKKADSLLQEVVDQVKELGGSPARMLFILNRIDELRKDLDWKESEEDFVKRTTKAIKEKLKENLAEFSGEIDGLQIIKLSSLPALLSLIMTNENSEAKRIDASDRLDKFFKYLIPEDVDYDLPKNVNNWTDHDRQRLAEAIWPITYADEFHEKLKQHIQDNYPQLVIPQILKKFQKDAAYKLVEWASQTTSAVINSSEDNYQSECQRIQDIRKNLNQFIREKETELREPFDKIQGVLKTIGKAEESSNPTDPLTKLEQIINNLGKPENNSYFQPIAKRLIPLYDWPRSTTNIIEKITRDILDYLEGKKCSLDSNVFESAKPNNVYLLEGHIKDLIKLNYPQQAGHKIEARTEEEKEQLEYLNRKLNELAKVLQEVVNDVAEQVLKREMNRVGDTIESLFAFHLESLEMGAKEIAPGLGINFSQTELIKVEFNKKPEFSFEGDCHIFEETYKEKVREIIGTERIWWTLFLWKKDIYQTKIEERSSDNAKIPSFDDLEIGWRFQRIRGEMEVLKQVSDWCLKQLKQFNRGIENFQQEFIDRYQERLDKAYNKIDFEHQIKIKTWQPLKEEAESISEKVKQLNRGWRTSK